MKRCKSCGEMKAHEEFYRNSKMKDGRVNHCRECSAAAAREAHKLNPLPRKAAARRFRVRHAEKRAAERRAYRAEEKRRERERHPGKAKARRAVESAVRAGRLPKPSVCCRCETGVPCAADLHAHHHDYSKPLEVEWLCRSCHAVAHGTIDWESVLV